MPTYNPAALNANSYYKPQLYVKPAVNIHTSCSVDTLTRDLDNFNTKYFNASIEQGKSAGSAVIAMAITIVSTPFATPLIGACLREFAIIPVVLAYFVTLILSRSRMNSFTEMMQVKRVNYPEYDAWNKCTDSGNKLSFSFLQETIKGIQSTASTASTLHGWAFGILITILSVAVCIGCVLGAQYYNERRHAAYDQILEE